MKTQIDISCPDCHSPSLKKMAKKAMVSKNTSVRTANVNSLVIMTSTVKPVDINLRD